MPRSSNGKPVWMLVLVMFWMGIAGAARADTEALDPVSLVAEYVRLNTTNPPGNEQITARYLADLLAREGIASELIEIGPGRANLVAKLAGDGSKKGLLLSHHMDVVHADTARWSVDPFGGEVKDGFLYGRGTLDMKTSGILQALTLIRLKREGVALARDVVLVATCDEEVDAIGMSKLIEARPELFRGIEFSLTEGEVIEAEGDQIRSCNVDISEKSVMWLRLTASGRAGHGSVPFDQGNAVNALLRALGRVLDYQTPLRVLPSVQRYFTALHDRFPGLDPARLDQLETSLADPAFRAAFLAEPHHGALVRNTISITVLRGGPQTNVIPGTASAELDCRLLPGEDPERFLTTIRNVIADSTITIETIGEVLPATASSTDTDLFRAIEKVAARFHPGVPVVPTILTSWTESSLLRPLGIHAYGFAPYVLPPEEYWRAHGDDERISIENIRRGAEILYAIVRETAGKQGGGATSGH